MATTLYSKKSTGIQSERGFTLAELLIVVAIIAVLTAIAIPVFTSQLEKSREATDFANVRSAYAELMAEALTDSASSPLKQADGTFKITVSPLVQKVDGWTTKTDEMDIGGVPSEKWTGSPVANGSCTITFDPVTGVVSINWSGEATSGGSSSSGSGTSGGNSNVVTLPDNIPKNPGVSAEATPIQTTVADGEGRLFYIDSNGVQQPVEKGIVYRRQHSIGDEDFLTIINGKWYEWVDVYGGAPGRWVSETSGDDYYWNGSQNQWMIYP